MAYSVDLAYLDFFECAAEGKYNHNPLYDRLKIVGVGAAMTLIASCRIIGRLISLSIETVKTIFYLLATIFTLGRFGNAARFKSHLKLFLLNLFALIAKPLQIFFQILGLGAGILSPKAGYRLMQIACYCVAVITSHENKILQKYKN